jgi:ubiquinone/menaquinone biosynthesis C-methylase UbiE
MDDSADPFAALDPQHYYDDYGYDEWERLRATRKATFEFENTVEYLKAHLPESGHVLDAGGGAGRYTVWLAEHGYEVTLVDLSDEQRRIAQQKVEDRNLSNHVSIEAGDIRSLAGSDGTYDAVLCCGGPLSHVVDADERATTLQELWRVATAGAPVFISVMGRLAVLQSITKSAPHLYPLLPHLAETGDWSREVAQESLDEPEFVECHFFRVEELKRDLDREGFDVVAIAGLEGVASNFDHEVEEANEKQQEYLAEVVQETREDEAVADLSNHILAVCRAEKQTE